MKTCDEVHFNVKALATLLLGIAGLVMAARRFGLRPGIVHERLFERLPDDFLPKWMVLNITAIREQNDRILAILGEDTEEARSVGT